MAELHISQDGIFQEILRNLLGVLLLAEIARVNLLGTLEHADMHDVVVINILHLQTIIIKGTVGDLVFRGVNGNIPMIALTIIRHDRVGLHLMRVIHDLWRIMHKLFVNIRIVALLQFDDVTILITEPEEMFCLFFDTILCT